MVNAISCVQPRDRLVRKSLESHSRSRRLATGASRFTLQLITKLERMWVGPELQPDHREIEIDGSAKMKSAGIHSPGSSLIMER